MNYKALKGFTYNGKDYFKGDNIKVDEKDVNTLQYQKRIEKTKEAAENKAVGLKKSKTKKRFWKK